MEILFLTQPTLSFLPPPLSSLSLLCPIRVHTGQYGQYADHGKHMGRRVEGDGEWVGRTRGWDQHRQRRRVVHPGSPASMLFRVVVVVCGWWWSRVREVGGSGVEGCGQGAVRVWGGWGVGWMGCGMDGVEKGGVDGGDHCRRLRRPRPTPWHGADRRRDGWRGWRGWRGMDGDGEGWMGMEGDGRG